ncbi:MAG TPA: class I SAM-dependent methyltransferase [Candidatus Binatia bacterium]|nr:class I SAM-dependent methyltransferase [Candidatus Binatia bacterium]
MDDVRSFYDGLAPLYHLVFENWDASVARQGSQLAGLIAERWGRDARVVLDGAVGIGTQALGLLGRGFHVVASDLSPGAVRRARREAAARGLRLPAAVADFRALPLATACADVVLIADNALPHLDTEADIALALRECFRCTRPGGGCLITLRDYGPPPPAGTVETHPYGERSWNGRRYDVRQVWTWRGRRYGVSFEIAPLDGAERATVLTTSYLAIPVADVAALMRRAGFEGVERIDGRFFQPIVAGTRPRRA